MKGSKYSRSKAKRATMKDVAKMAGVTIGTVSHVINGTAPITPETAEKVRQAIRELDYVPNSLAKNMRTHKNKMVGFLVPRLTNSFYARIASAYMEEAQKENYTVSIMDYGYSLEQEKKELYGLLQNNVGTIILANGSKDEAYIESIRDKGVQVILMDRWSDIPGISYIAYDNIDVIVETVGTLKEKNYKTIGFISEPLDLVNLRDRFAGYKMGLRKYGYAFNEKYVFISDVFQMDHVEKGYQYTLQLLETYPKEELPQAYIVSSDLIAIGMIKALKDKGYKVPGDFGIVGCDNLEISGYVQPPLTTIQQNRREMGAELWRMTKSLNDGLPIGNIKLKQKLIVRESC
jgi:DNA-binding LacI/PurR family transcriptional regulator